MLESHRSVSLPRVDLDRGLRKAKPAGVQIPSGIHLERSDQGYRALSFFKQCDKMFGKERVDLRSRRLGAPLSSRFYSTSLNFPIMV